GAPAARGYRWPTCCAGRSRRRAQSCPPQSHRPPGPRVQVDGSTSDSPSRIWLTLAKVRLAKVRRVTSWCPGRHPHSSFLGGENPLHSHLDVGRLGKTRQSLDDPHRTTLSVRPLERSNEIGRPRCARDADGVVAAKRRRDIERERIG